jgi:hypothetical protein
VNDPTSAGLLEVAGPQLYRRNAFRITGLPTDADRRAVRHRQQKIIPALEMGIDPGLGHSLPVEPDDVRRAFDLILGDPRRRLVDELFWLWDTPGATCGCSQALHVDHDKAVQAHSAALDQEAMGDSLTDEQLDELEVLWTKASTLWNMALRRAAFWDHVRHRITALDDKQLNDSVIDLLRDELPITLVKPLIQLAAKSTTESSWLAEQARSWPIPTVVVDDQLEAAAEPVYDAVKAGLAEAVQPLNAGDPDKATELLYENVLPLLKRLNALVPATRHRRTASTRNDVAVVFNNCAIRLIDDTGPAAEQSARKWLKAAQKLTSDQHTVDLIEANTRTLDEIVTAFRNIKQRVQELRSYGRTDLARQMLRNIRRDMAGSAGVGEIDKMLAELGDYSAARREKAYENALERRVQRAAFRQTPAGRIRRLIFWLVVIGVLFVLGYFLFFDGPSATAVRLFEPKSGNNAPVGTCVETREGWDGPKSEVPSVPCDDDHWGEVVGYISLAATVPSPYPGVDQTAAQAHYNCVYMQALKGLDTDDYTVDYTYPSQAEWNDGRTAGATGENYATCVVHRKDGEPVDHKLSRAEDSSNVVWHMDIASTNATENPPVGACVHTVQSYSTNVHNVAFIECGTEHWGEIIGYPVLYQPGHPWPGNNVVSTDAEAACQKLALDRGLADRSAYRISSAWPRSEASYDQDRKVYGTCVASKADGSALKGQLK